LKHTFNRATTVSPPYAKINRALLRKTDRKKEKMVLKIRYLTVIMGFLNLLNIYATSRNINIALIKMVFPKSKTQSEDSCLKNDIIHVNSTISENELSGNDSRFDWNDQEQGSILGGYFIGYTGAMLPASYAVRKYGQRHLLTFTLIMSGIMNFLLPVMASTSVELAMVNRIIVGAIQSPILPAQQGILVPWSPLDEATRMLSFQATGILVGTLILFVGGPHLMNAYGWEYVFWVCGASNLLFGFLFFAIVRNRPEDCSFISPEELKHITQERNQSQNTKSKAVPIKAIMTSMPFWAIFATLVNYWQIHTLFMFLYPKYLSDIQGIPVETIGYLTALPIFIEFFVQTLGGVFADNLYQRNFSIGWIRNFMGFIAQVLPGLCSFAFFFIGCNLNFANAIAIIALPISSLQISGGFANINDICPSYVTSAFAILNTMASLTSFLIIHFGGMVLEKVGNNQFSWGLIFSFTGITSLIGGLFYLKFSSGREQDWSSKAAKSKNLNS